MAVAEDEYLSCLDKLEDCIKSIKEISSRMEVLWITCIGEVYKIEEAVEDIRHNLVSELIDDKDCYHGKEKN